MVLLLIGSLAFGGPKFLLRLKSSYGKLFVVNSLRLIRLRRGTGRALTAVSYVVLLRIPNIFFFHCSLAKFIWSCIRLWLHVNWNPSSFEDLRQYTNSLSGQSKRVFLVGWAAMCWALWTTRNKFTIEHIFPTNPVNRLFKATIFLQQWRSLIKDGDLQAFDDMLSRMNSTVSTLLRHSRQNPPQ